MSIGLRSVLYPWRKLGFLLLFAFAGAVAGYQIHQQFFLERAPAQPIAFSHQRHAGELNLPCQQCHVHAERSTSAGVPPVSKCAGCHKVVASDKPEIVKLMAYWQNQEPIPWLKVHDLPDFVHFTHKRHVRAGVSCQTCHGPVETMAVVTRVQDLTMGWCTDCHRERAVRFGLDCWTCHK